MTNIDNSSTDQQWTDYNLIQPAHVIHGETTTIRGNGDDAYELLDNSSALIDVYGVQTEDGTGTSWDYTDSYAYRNLDITNPNATFTLSEWTIAGADVLDGMSSDLSSFLTPGYRALSGENDIISFTIPQETGPANINSTSHTIDIEVSAVADVSNLTPTIGISTSASINPPGGEAQDFTTPFTYTVTAQNGDPQDWIVTVTQASGASSEADILTFTLPEQTAPANINATNQTVEIGVPFGTDVTSLTPSITVSPGALITPMSGTAQDFSNPFDYTVIAEDGATYLVWTVTVIIGASTENDILTFTIPEQTGSASIDATNHTVDIEVANGSNLASLTPSITISADASINPASGTSQDFTNPFT
ncbi:MAG: hypothetical protein C0594_11250, partial [Marinilabiliales bacterium]